MGVSGRGKSRGTKNWKNKIFFCISALGPGGHGRPRESPDGCVGWAPGRLPCSIQRLGREPVEWPAGRPVNSRPAPSLPPSLPFCVHRLAGWLPGRQAAACLECLGRPVCSPCSQCRLGDRPVDDCSARGNDRTRWLAGYGRSPVFANNFSVSPPLGACIKTCF